VNNFAVRVYPTDDPNLPMRVLSQFLPEGSPPKWMFGNISAIRKNTERIELLELSRLQVIRSDWTKRGLRLKGAVTW